MGESPAFRFYPSDWLMGTITFSVAEDGAYLRCVMHQWGAGAVPGDDVRALARIMRVSDREARKLWAAISGKFTRGDDGLWRNQRLEQERAKQVSYREAQAENGRKSAKARAERGNGGSTNPPTPVEPTHQPTTQPTTQPDSTFCFQSSFSSSPSDPPAKSAGGERGGVILSSVDFARLQRNNAYVGARLRVPHKLHGDFVAALGGSSPDLTLRAWYAVIDEEIERTGEAIVPDVWKWLERRFKAWASSQAEDAEMAKFLAEGA